MTFFSEWDGWIHDALVRALPPSDQCPPRLLEALSYALLSPGKRIRPCLVLSACEACGGNTEDALVPAASVELIHAYSLIHDDLPAMDDDTLRRGRPTVHIQFDEATAILAGDALLARSFEWLATGFRPKQRLRDAVVELAAAAGAVHLVGGQMDDLSSENSVGPNLAQLESIHRRKTGALINVSLYLGGLTAEAVDWQLEALSRYGDAVGLAFQIVDDLLDHAGETEKLGKNAGRDSERGKLTYPSLLGVPETREYAKQLIDSAIEAAQLFGDAGQRLEKIARFIIQRV